MDSSWKTIPAHEDTPSYAYLTTPLKKSEQDDIDYRLIRLENGLQAVLAHDSLTDKAAACLRVAVGGMQDPPDMFGLAHFCEHMLSKGSAPFPAENDFLSYIRSNGGFRNATTGPARTKYWFCIGPNMLAGGLERLAAFFHSPLFSPSVTARELNAVDSENKKNLQNDDRRAIQLEKSLTIVGHPWNRFNTGNLESLTATAKMLERNGSLPLSEAETQGDGGPVGRETRRRLAEWWKKEYCAGRMTLAVLGRESLDQLAGLVAKYFSPIANLGIDPRPTVTEPCWGPEEMGSIVFVKTVKDLHVLSLTFPLPYQQPHYRSKPARFISHMLEHEGPGSIYAYLKKQGWIMDLHAVPQTWNPGTQYFQISLTLTSSGMTYFTVVLQEIYCYINLLRSSPFATFIHEEMRKLSEINFRFRERIEAHTYANFLAEELAEPYPPDLILSASTLISDWDETLVRETLRDFIPERSRVMLRARTHDNIPMTTAWETERWYGTQYHVERLSDVLFKTPQTQTNPDIYLPNPNQYIPEHLEVPPNSISEPAKQPNCIRETPLCTLWHKSDDRFRVPKADVMLDIRSPLAYATPRHAVLTKLLADLLRDSLAEVTYDATLAGLNYTIRAHEKGLLVSFGGFSDKIPSLMHTVLDKVKNLVIDPRRYTVVAEQLKLEYENFYLDSPFVISDYQRAVLLTATVWSPAERLAELLVITEDDVRRHKEELLSRVYVESLVNGNFDSQAAVDLIKASEDILASRPLASSERFSDRCFILPEGSNFVKEAVVADPKELNSSLSYYCHFGDIADAGLRPILDLVIHMMREPCFSQLRTKEQLGYVIITLPWYGPGSMGLCITIQSSRDPVYLEERVDSFLSTFHKKLEGLSEKELETQKDGLIVKKLRTLKNLHQASSTFWNHISSGYCDFIRDETDASAIRNLTLRELLDAYSALVHPQSPTRRKLSVHLRSQNLERLPLGPQAVVIEDEVTFKAGLTLSPSPVPLPRGLSHDGRSISRL